MDGSALAVIATVSATYLRCRQRSEKTGAVGRKQVWSFVVGIAVWCAATFSAIGVYAPVLFWVRSLQVVLLLFLAPFLLALGRPLTVVGAASASVRRLEASVLRSKVGRMAGSPLVTSVGMLATPWLLYLTPWYVASMTGPLAAATRLLLVLVGFAYFYARLQTDPVPHRFSPLLSIGISVVESLADGVLGIVLWLGPLIAVDYYASLRRDWGPGLRVDQSIGAGILWILGDILSIPFVVVLMRQLGTHERRRAAQVDAALDDVAADDGPDSTLWWETDPQLRDRFSR